MTIKELVQEYGIRKCVDEKGKRYIIVPISLDRMSALKIANKYFHMAYDNLEIKKVYATPTGTRVYVKKKLLVFGETLYWGICRKQRHNYE